MQEKLSEHERIYTELTESILKVNIQQHRFLQV